MEEEKINNKSKKNWLWIIGVIVFVIIVLRIISYTMTQTAMKKLSNVIENSAISYNGISFDYTYGWSFEKEELPHNTYYISGANGIGFEHSVMLMPDASAKAEDFINNIIAGYNSSGELKVIKQSNIYSTKYNTFASKAADYTMKMNSDLLYGKTFVIIKNGYTIVINQIAPSEKQLSSFDFSIMEKTFKFNK